MGLLTFSINVTLDGCVDPPPPAMREWAAKLEAKPKYVVSSTRKDVPRTSSHHIAGDLRTAVQKLKDATPSTPDRRPRPDPVRDRAAQHATR